MVTSSASTGQGVSKGSDIEQLVHWIASQAMTDSDFLQQRMGDSTYWASIKKKEFLEAVHRLEHLQSPSEVKYFMRSLLNAEKLFKAQRQLLEKSAARNKYYTPLTDLEIRERECRSFFVGLLVNNGSLAARRLIAGLKTGSWYDHEYIETEALIRIGPAAVPPLLKALKSNTAPKGKIASILGKIGDPRAIVPLMKLIEEGVGEIEIFAEALADTLNHKQLPIADKNRILELPLVKKIVDAREKAISSRITDEFDKWNNPSDW